MKFKIAGLLITVMLFSISAWPNYSFRGGRGSADESAHSLSIGGGISSPSTTSSLDENPAGLIYNSDPKFLGGIGTDHSNFNPFGIEAGFFTGNGSVGGAIAYKGFNERTAGGGGTIHLLEFGVGALVDSLNLSIGTSGSYTFYQTGKVSGTGSGSANLNMDIGAIYNPKGPTRLGFTAYQVVNHVAALGAGVATEIAQGATFSLDGTADTKFNGKIIKPTLGVSVDDFQLVYGYGLRLDDKGDPWIREHSAVGVGLRVSPKVELEGYYNQIATYYAGVTIKL